MCLLYSYLVSVSTSFGFLFKKFKGVAIQQTLVYSYLYMVSTPMLYFDNTEIFRPTLEIRK